MIAEMEADAAEIVGLRDKVATLEAQLAEVMGSASRLIQTLDEMPQTAVVNQRVCDLAGQMSLARATLAKNGGAA